MNRPTSTPEPTALRRDRERHAALRRAISELGFFRRGNLVEVYGRCGKKGCCCAAEPPRLHGPYLQWTRKVSGKTVSVRVRPEHENLMKEWIRNSRRLDRLIAQMQKLSMRATERILRLESQPKPQARPLRTRVRNGLG